MKPNSRLSHLIEAARRQPLPPGHDREPPPGFAVQMAARAWRDAGNGVLDESVPWLTGLSWGFAGSALIAAAADGKEIVDDACAKKAVAELTRE